MSALSGTGNGFLFDPQSKESLLSAFKHALEVYRDRESWESVMLRGMTMEFSWDAAAGDYRLGADSPARRIRPDGGPVGAETLWNPPKQER